jgi:hypothetical protein
MADGVFVTLLGRLVRSIDRQTQRALQAVADLVGDLRTEIVSLLSEAKGFELQRLTELQASIADAASRFSTGMRAEVLEGQAVAIDGGIALVDAPLRSADLTFVAQDIASALLRSVSAQTGSLITNISENLRRDITREVQLGALGIKSPFDVISAIRDALRTEGAASPQGYAARAEAITRTEIGRAQSEATQARMEQAARDVPGLYKQWSHGGSRIPRPTHVAASGQRRRVNEAFNIGGVSMRYPRDAAAPASETVNCRCIAVPSLT